MRRGERLRRNAACGTERRQAWRSAFVDTVVLSCRSLRMAIALTVTAALPMTAAEFAAQILVLENWKDFTGYGPVPGIESAHFETRTPEIVGSRIRVVDVGGTTHREEIVEWNPARRLRLRFDDFSPPLCYLADHFEETFEFESQGDSTRVTRSMLLEPRIFLAWPILWFLSFFIEAALARHLSDIQQAASRDRTHNA